MILLLAVIPNNWEQTMPFDFDKWYWCCAVNQNIFLCVHILNSFHLKWSFYSLETFVAMQILFLEIKAVRQSIKLDAASVMQFVIYMCLYIVIYFGHCTWFIIDP